MAQVALPGHVHPKATAANDRGRVDSSLVLNDVVILLKPSSAQQADLTQLLAQQQDPASPNYHKWLTPEQYGARFGAAQADVDRIVNWLTGSNLKIVSVGRARNSISFSGPVRQVEQAFGTEIHNFSVNGETHFANVSVPAVPSTVGNLILAVHGLNDFRKKPFYKGYRPLPKYTSGTAGTHYIAPDDIAAIYDIKPLLNGGIDGAGQKIVIVGQTAINISDIQQFRSYFNLPVMNPQLVTVPGATIPGILSGDEQEADLDIEFSGAVARNATIIFVYCNDVDLSLQYAIDQNLAPVISMSYGDCESDTGVSGQFGLSAYSTMAQQANSQGITWMAASGDNGAADCYEDNLRGNAGALAAIDSPGSTPEVTSVGGTEFNEGSGTYFAAVNDPNHSSVSTYIPEMVWNDSALDGEPSASGGGASIYFTKPSWQTGPGVPNDGFRDVPDIAFTASDDHDPMLFFSDGTLGLIGGTSVAAPTFGGIVGLLNQYVVVNGLQSAPGVGNVNPNLYALAQSVPDAFHDVTVGNNIVNGCEGVRGCSAGPVGFNAGPGFDQASGLGSLDVFNFISSYNRTGTAAKAVVTMTLQGSVSTSGVATFSAVVSSSNGGTPTGTVKLIAAGSTVATATLAASGTGQSTANFTIQPSQLPAGFDSVSAEYSGDSSYASAGASTGASLPTTSIMAINGITNAASYKQAYAPGEIMAVFGTLLSGSTQSAPGTPLPTTLGGVTATINGTAVPLYFVSPGQINLQIPYGLAADSIATLVVTYNGQSASSEFLITSAAPGIFVDPATGAPAGAESAQRGQTIAIYVTGQGAVNPQPSTGATPASGTVPTPTILPIVSVGGVTVSTPYVYVGIPAWSVGVTQINFTIPLSVPTGSQAVVVTSGTSVSAAAPILITQ